MRIAQVAPLFESVPPQLYGGTERVVSYLTEALATMGHEVTLFATGDSVTRARLHAVCPRALRLDPRPHDHIAYYVRMLEQVYRNAHAFDVIHAHIDYLHYPLARRHHTPNVTTLHGPLGHPDLMPLYDEFADINVVSISDAQRAPLPHARWRGTVYHGLPADLHRFHTSPGTYLAFLGRVSPEKGIEQAIAIASRVGMPLKIAAKVDKTDAAYFHEVIQPLLHDPRIEFIGEIGEQEKEKFLGAAYALLFPIQWAEPFGLVMIEAMACGTPIIALRAGSVPEVMEDGVTGFVCDSVEACIAAVPRIATLSRAACRAVFERRFTAERMARDYLRIFEQLRAEVV